MDRLNKVITWLSITSELSHLFCCGLPILFSILGLLSGIGVMAAMPSGFMALHEYMHEYEIPMMVLSFSILMLGWILYGVAKKLDCHEHGCCHGACAPKKKSSLRILVLATILFFLNIFTYFNLHT